MSMLRLIVVFTVVGGLFGQNAAAWGAESELPARKTLAEGLVNPESAAVGHDGRIYVSVIGERDKEGDGQVAVLSGGKAVPFASGLDDPKGVVSVGNTLFVADRQRVWRIDRAGKAEVFAAKEAFPKPPMFLNDIAADRQGNLYVSDSGDRKGTGGKVFAIDRQGKVTLILDAEQATEIKMPNGLLVEGDSHLLLADFLAGILYRISLADKTRVKVAEDLGAGDGIVRDAAGNLFVSDYKGGRVFRIAPGAEKPELLAEGFQNSADMCLGPTGRSLLVPDMKTGTVVELPVAPGPAVAPMLSGLKNPESVVFVNGAFYISVIGEFGKDGDGSIVWFTPGKPSKELAKGLDDPKGLVFVKDTFYVADKTQVLKVDKLGKVSPFAAADAFPRKPLFLNDLVADKAGNLYVSDSGDLQGSGGVVYRISPEGKVTVVVDGAKNPAVKTPNGLVFDSQGELLLLDFTSGELSRVNQTDGSLAKVAEGFLGGDGLAYDIDGNLYISQWSTGKVHVLPQGSKQPRLFANQFTSAADSCLDPGTGRLMIPDMKAGTLTGLPVLSGVPTDIDDSPLAVTIEPAYPNLQFDRPIVLTHAGDGSKRVFVASQKGKVYLLPENQNVEKAELFFDLSKKVSYKDNQNEEGFLGMAFHPKFRTNGEFFVYYTTTEKPLTSVISRFKVHPDKPNLAEVSTEEELLRIPQPYWNHNGGTLVFGPDGGLYVGLGDGGSGNDPHGNGQNLKTLLGAILRINVDAKDPGLAYAIPKDNPFVGNKDARPEIWAYGVRNIWRMSFDRKTGDCWAADVGQNLWEEINIVTAGANCGWNPRESMHRFTEQGAAPRADLLEPIWEYHHDIGKSVTGGHVYRGTRVPELDGHYLYADYVTGRVWGLNYDTAKKRVVANRPIFGNISPILSFGEDESGDVYFLTVQGKLFRFASAK